nr:MBL fold metallo-hydrolase [Corynebacterium uropygiale]
MGALLGATVLSSTLLVGCASEQGEDHGAQNQAEEAHAGPYAEAAAANINRYVAENYERTPQILADSDGTGAEAVARFHDTSETLIVSAPTDAAQLRAASIAVWTHTPMLTVRPGTEKNLQDSLKQLQPRKVLVVGDVKTEDITPRREEGDSPDRPDPEFLLDTGTPESLEALTATQFVEKQVERPEDMVKSVVDLDGKEAVLLVPAWDTYAPSPEAKEKPGALPSRSAEDAGSTPITIASPESALAAVGTARAFGADVRFMPYPDPRLSDETMRMVAGLADKPLLALGAQFGSAKILSEKIERGERVTAEQPGGGQLVFPGRRMVALYGHPSGPALGALGEQDPAASVERVKQLVAEYQKFDSQPIIPAFEIIGTVAAADPGPEGTYSTEFSTESLSEYVDAITQAGGYAVIDLQPGRARLLDQAKKFEELLKRPNVGLALDPEWKLEADEQPMSSVGHVQAAEIDEVSDWLAQLVKDNDLPQKPLVIHQFQLQMIRDRETLNLDHPELAFVLHADGHGSREEKLGTWDVMQKDLDPRFFMAWKNFFDEDQPLFSPEQTYTDVAPRPWFVSYQ